MWRAFVTVAPREKRRLVRTRSARTTARRRTGSSGWSNCLRTSATSRSSSTSLRTRWSCGACA